MGMNWHAACGTLNGFWSLICVTYLLNNALMFDLAVPWRAIFRKMSWGEKVLVFVHNEPKFPSDVGVVKADRIVVLSRTGTVQTRVRGTRWKRIQCSWTLEVIWASKAWASVRTGSPAHPYAGSAGNLFPCALGSLRKCCTVSVEQPLCSRLPSGTTVLWLIFTRLWSWSSLACVLWPFVTSVFV